MCVSSRQQAPGLYCSIQLDSLYHFKTNPPKRKKGENKQMVQIIKGNKTIDLDTLISAAILNINGI